MNKKIFLILVLGLSFLLPVFYTGRMKASSLGNISTVDKSYYGADNDEEANGYGHEEDESTNSTNLIVVVIGSIVGVGVIGTLIYIAKKNNTNNKE